MVPEAHLEQADHGLVPKGPGWYVVNARDVQWWGAEGRGAYSRLEGEPEFEQLGLHLVTLAPATRWRCTTGRPTRRASSCWPARRS